MKTIKYMETTASSALEEIIVSAKKICTYEMEQQVVVSTSQSAKDNFFLRRVEIIGEFEKVKKMKKRNYT